MCRAISFFSMSNDAQLESGAIQDTRILTGSAFDAPCARSEIAATSPIHQNRTSRICPSHAGPARKLTIATLADEPQPRPFRLCVRPACWPCAASLSDSSAHSQNERLWKRGSGAREYAPEPKSAQPPIAPEMMRSRKRRDAPPQPDLDPSLA